MSSREMAHKILDNMNEEQIIGFITLFGENNSMDISHNEYDKEKVYQELCGMIKSIQDLDYDEEVKSYREEKYGV